MADGFNEARAMRVAEIVQDFRALQHQISQVQAVPLPVDYNSHGYALLQQCIAEGHTTLHAEFRSSPSSPDGDPEQEKQALQYVMLDASARRFQARRIYLRAMAAIRWINSRNALLNGQIPTAAHQSQLQQIDTMLQNDLTQITNVTIHQQFLIDDQQAGKWVNEDPNLATIEHWIARGFQ